MEWKTHGLSGVLAGYLVTNDWKGALVGGIASLISDLDEPKSKFGKILLPVSIPLNRIFGHRTFTHSLLFALIMSAIFMPFTDTWVWLSVFVGISAHIVGDMLTGKVKLFYPLNYSVGISIPRYMFTTIDRLARLLLIIVMFIILIKKINII